MTEPELGFSNTLHAGAERGVLMSSFFGSEFAVFADACRARYETDVQETDVEFLDEVSCGVTITLRISTAPSRSCM